MRLHIDDSYFLSVIEKDTGYFSVQVMQLVHGIGMYNATMFDNQLDVVSCIVHEGTQGFTVTELFTDSLSEIFAFHKQKLIEVIKAKQLA